MFVVCIKSKLDNTDSIHTDGYVPFYTNHSKCVRRFFYHLMYLSRWSALRNCGYLRNSLYLIQTLAHPLPTTPSLAMRAGSTPPLPPFNVCMSFSLEDNPSCVPLLGTCYVVNQFKTLWCLLVNIHGFLRDSEIRWVDSCVLKCVSVVQSDCDKWNKTELPKDSNF